MSTDTQIDDYPKADAGNASESGPGPKMRQPYRVPDGVVRSGAPLPIPPGRREEKYCYVGRRMWILTLGSMISFPALVISQVAFIHLSPRLMLIMPFVAFTIFYYLVSLSVNAFSKEFDLDKHIALVAGWQPEKYPSVDVMLPVCGEPLEILHNTWRYVEAMLAHYPGEGRAYVLDDSGKPEVVALAAEFGFFCGTRENRGWFKKAGNLHYGLAQSSGEFALILDADFVPRYDMLDETLPYFIEDPKLGILQTPQFFRVIPGQTWVERGAGAVQELFYRVVQVSRQSRGGAICVGTNAMYRRAALDENGGTTLIEHSEDVHTGFDLRRLGWSLRYIPIALAAGICPEEIEPFYSQQYRWCSGSMSLLGSSKFWKMKMRPVTRLCYISGFFYYIHTALSTFFAPLIPIILCAFLPDHVKIVNYLLILPSLLYTMVIFPLWHRSPYRLSAWAVKMVYAWAHFFAIWDIFRGTPMGWQPTGAVIKKRKTRRLWTGVAIWGGGTALAWMGLAAYRMWTMNAPDFTLVFLTGVFYTLVVGRVLTVKLGKEERAR